MTVPDAKARHRALEKAARSIEAELPGARVDNAVAPAAVRSLTPQRRTELDSAIARVSAERIVWNAPRKTTGAVDAAAALALIPLGDADRRPGTREPWLVARARRDGPGSFVLSVEELISENESHRWDRTPWRWDSTDRTPPAVRWGGTLDALRTDLTDLDAGRWLVVLERAGIVTGDPLAALLAGRDADRSLADLTAVWLPRLAGWMARMATWRIAGATNALRKGKPMRLFGLGGVTQVRKPGVFLAGEPSAPRLLLEFSASNERVSEALWTRPLELDLVHAGLVERSTVER